MAEPLHEIRFPGESLAYREARDKLLRAELALRRQIETVAAQRRALPPGGEIPEDYLFSEGDAAAPVRLSELFGAHDTLIAYSFMYSPAMARPCPSCTSILDAVDGDVAPVIQRASLVAIASSPIGRIMAFARERRWRRLRLLSSAGTTYNADYHGQDADGGQIPAINVFVRRDGVIRHSWGAELLYAPFDPGQDGRHVDLIWPLWGLLDMTPEGRGDFHPRLAYD